MKSEFNGTVGVYVRVSTVEQAQEGYSIAAQRERLQNYCKAQGWEDVKFYVDEGVSARDTKRPQLTQLLNHVKEKKINLILVYRLDRFTRSVRDLHKMLEVMDKFDCGFRSATEVYDTTSAMGRLFITIVAALAEWESANSSERIKMMLEKKVSDGERVGNIPYGFILNEKETLDIEPDESLVILDMIEKLKSGMRPNAIALELKKSGNMDRAWTPISVFRILQNPALYGATQWNDKVYKNTHEGIITEEEFNLVQSIIGERKHVRNPHAESNYIFQGVIKCEGCKRTMSVNRYSRTLADGTKRHSATYRCRYCASEGNVHTPGEVAIINALHEYMEGFEMLGEDVEVEVEEDNEIIHLKKELNRLENMRAKFQRGWAADLIEDDEFTKLMAETLPPYEDVKRKIENYKEPIAINKNDIKETVLLFNRNFKKLTLHERRSFIAQFIKEIHYKMIPQPPKNPRYKKGRPKLTISNVVFR